MKDIHVGRYDNPEKTGGWAGWVEPADKSWIIFIASDGTTQFYPKREADTGAVIGNPAS